MILNYIKKNIIALVMISSSWQLHAEVVAREDDSYSEGYALMQLIGYNPPSTGQDKGLLYATTSKMLIDVDGTNVEFSIFGKKRNRFTYIARVDDRVLHRGSGVFLVGRSAQDVAAKMLTERVQDCSATIDVVSSCMVVEGASIGSTWVWKNVGQGYCAYFEGDQAVSISGFRSDITLAKRIIIGLLGELRRH